MSEKLTRFTDTYYRQHTGIDGLLVTDPVNRRYLLGFASSAGTLVILPEQSYFIIDFRYIEVAKKRISGCEVLLQDRLYDQLEEIFQRHGVKTIGVEDDKLTLSGFATYQERLKGYRLQKGSGLCDTLLKQRKIKTPDEIEKIQAAQIIADKAFTEILNFIKPGVTEKQIAVELEYYMKKQGADGLSFDTIAVAGKNSSLPHGVPSDYRVQSGDFITMDYGALVDGYHSDMTRTVGVGSVSEEQRRVYDTVLKAQMMALEAIKPGKSCSEIDAVARDYIYQCGYEGCFGHGLGHGVGLEIHEEPRFSPLCHELLEPNMVITVEPGIYLEGQFGVRIEDFVVITENSSLNLTKSEKNLICL